MGSLLREHLGIRWPSLHGWPHWICWLGMRSAEKHARTYNRKSTTDFCGPLGSYHQRGHVTVECRCTFGVVFPISKERQLHIHCGEWSFSKKCISVSRITTDRMGQIVKENGVELLKLSNLMIFTPSLH